MTNLLVRRFTSDLDTSFTLNTSQLEGDQALSGFTQGASDWRSLLAMTAGAFAYRASKLGILLGSNSSVSRLLAPVFSLALEVSVFRGTHSILTSSASSSHFSWSTDFVNFASLKFFGRISQGQNPILSHLLQDAGMVAGHHLAHGLSLATRPEGSLLQQFAQAEMLNLQMQAGMGLWQGLSGRRLAQMERVLEIQSRLLETSAISARFQGRSLPEMAAVEMMDATQMQRVLETSIVLNAHARLRFAGAFSRAELRSILEALYERNLPPLVSNESLLALGRIRDFQLRRKQFVQTLLQRPAVANDGEVGRARFVDFHSLKAEADRIEVVNSVAQSAWIKEALRELQEGVVLADCNFGRRETYLRVLDHHGVYSQARNSAQQMLDLFENTLRHTSGDVEAALQILKLREISTDNLADGGWCVWMAQNQRLVLADPALRNLIRAATTFEDFTAFGNNYERTDSAVELQAAIFKRYGENLRAANISGSDRFSSEVAPVVISKSMRDITKLLSDSELRQREAAAFWAEVDVAREVAKESVVLERRQEGRRLFAFYNTRTLQRFSIFAQWLSVPDIQRPFLQAEKLPLQATIAPMPSIPGPQGEVARILPIIAIPEGAQLPSGKGLLAVVKVMNEAEALKVESLKREGKLAADFKANFWFGKENVILPNPNNGGTLLNPEEIAEILMREELGLFVP